MASCCTALSVLVLILCISNVRSNIYPVLSDNRFDCGSSADGETCRITCDVSDQSVDSVLCRNAATCWISCDATKCLHSATIYAGNVSSTGTLMIFSTADQCLQNSTIYASNSSYVYVGVQPVSGTDKSTVQAMSGMTFYSGYDTIISIICKTRGSFITGNDECTDMTIYAENAFYFDLTATMEGTNIEGSVIYCPRNSPYEPPCLINASAPDVHGRNLVIYAPEGTPDGVTFIGSDSGDHYNTTLVCDAGLSTLMSAEYSFQV